MKARALAALAILSVSAPAAHAQTGILYRLESGSRLVQDRCLGPCLCPPHTATGPLLGTFTLTLSQQGPVFTTYRVSGVRWTSELAFEPVQIRGGGLYSIGGPVVLFHQMSLALTSSSPPDPAEIPYESENEPVNPKYPFPRIAIIIQAPQQGCAQNTIDLVASPVPCQADCDASGFLNANDFMCFINHFGVGDPYANCDGSSGDPALTANDFVCYVNRFAAGCP